MLSRAKNGYAEQFVTVHDGRQKITMSVLCIPSLHAVCCDAQKVSFFCENQSCNRYNECKQHMNYDHVRRTRMQLLRRRNDSAQKREATSCHSNSPVLFINGD